jgi:HSP20 family protein
VPFGTTRSHRGAEGSAIDQKHAIASASGAAGVCRVKRTTSMMRRPARPASARDRARVMQRQRSTLHARRPYREKEGTMAQVVKEKSVPVARMPEKAPEKAEEAEVIEKVEPRGTNLWRRPFDFMRQMLEWDPFDRHVPRLFSRYYEMYAPEFTVKETREAFIFKADVPGIALKDLEVTLTRTRLKVSGHRQEEKKEEGETFHTVERTFGSFTRSFALPEGVDAEKIAADLKDGVLTITIPKVPEAPPVAKKVEVKET